MAAGLFVRAAMARPLVRVHSNVFDRERSAGIRPIDASCGLAKPARRNTIPAGPRPNSVESMNVLSPQQLEIAVSNAGSVSALLITPPKALACYVLAHGAGAGMTHPAMSSVAAELAERGIATLRYQFPYMQQRSKRPDPPAICHATVRAAVARGQRAEAPPHRRRPFLRRAHDLAGAGQGAAPRRARPRLPRLSAAPRRQALGRARRAPLRRQGPDAVPARHARRPGRPIAAEPLVASLGKRATLHLFEDADHAFHVPARSGRKDVEVMDEILDAFAGWIDAIEAGKNTS